MKISEICKQKKATFSFEIFPPKATTPISSLYGKLDELASLKPDYISVTYGAGASLADMRTCELAGHIKNNCGIESMAHLTCVKSSKSNIEQVLAAFAEVGVKNIMALRGDIPQDGEVSKDFNYASDLVDYLQKHHDHDFDIAAACYPEAHPESPNIEADIVHLKTKVDCGATHLVSQLFFDNEDFYRFYERTLAAGINVPIQAGIMPVINTKSINRLVTNCGASLPKKFVRIMNLYENNALALFDAGIAYATEQIIDLLSSGVSGVHLYTMNNPKVASRISENISTIIEHINE